MTREFLLHIIEALVKREPAEALTIHFSELRERQGVDITTNPEPENVEIRLRRPDFDETLAERRARGGPL